MITEYFKNSKSLGKREKTKHDDEEDSYNIWM